jgi:hypothetical protein
MLTLIYLANIVVAGWISISALFFPKTSLTTVFSGDIQYSEAIRLVGCLWFAIFVLSFVGLFLPYQMSLVLLFQLIYKSMWLIFVALPSFINKKPFPKYMAIFFLVWVVILPFVIPWSLIFGF